MREVHFRRIITDDIENEKFEPEQFVSPLDFPIDFLREFKEYLPPRNHHFWLINRPQTKEQKRIWKEFGPKKIIWHELTDEQKRELRSEDNEDDI